MKWNKQVVQSIGGGAVAVGIQPKFWWGHGPKAPPVNWRPCVYVRAFELWISLRVCTVAPYPVLEASATVNGKSENVYPRLSQTRVTIWMPLQIYNYVQPWIQCAKFDLNQYSRYGSAHAWKTRFGVDF